MMEMSVCDHVIVAMACCHSLTIIDGEIIGDPMDMKMFEATHWVRWLILSSTLLSFSCYINLFNKFIL